MRPSVVYSLYSLVNIVVYCSEKRYKLTYDKCVPNCPADNCTLYDDTLKCVHQSSELLSKFASNLSRKSDNFFDKYDYSYTKCQNFTFQLEPLIRKLPNLAPVLYFNFSFQLSDPRTLALGLRQECLQIGSTSDSDTLQYCTNKSRPAWGQFYWTCRLFDFSSSSQNASSFPLHLAFDCFRTFAAFTILNIHVILYPQLCKNVYTFSLIDTLHFTTSTTENWLPFVYVDANDQRYVRIFFNTPMAGIQIDEILIEILKISSNHTKVEPFLAANSKIYIAGNHHIILEATFVNLHRGNYYAVITPLTLQCKNGERCSSNRVPFELTENLIYTPQEKNRRIWFNFSAIVLLLFVVVLLSLFLKRQIKRFRPYGAWRRGSTTAEIDSSIENLPLPAVTYERRPKIFMIYTDDCLEHRKCVLKLAEYLRDFVNCEVHIDEWMLSNPNIASQLRNESEWVLQCINDCDFYLIVFSQGSNVVFERHDQRSDLVELKQTRTWRETFNLAITCILEHITGETRLDPCTKLPKVICCSFDYDPLSLSRLDQSSNIPNSFRALPCSKYRLLNDLPQLIKHVHQLPTFYSVSPTGLHDLRSQMQCARNYFQENPDWLNSRLCPVQTVDREKIVRDLEAALSDVNQQQERNVGEFSSVSDLYDNVRYRHNRLSSDYPLAEISTTPVRNMRIDEEEEEEGHLEFALLPLESNKLDAKVPSESHTNRVDSSKQNAPLMILDYHNP